MEIELRRFSELRVSYTLIFLKLIHVRFLSLLLEQRKKSMMRSRKVVKQAHVRFDPTIAVMVPLEVAMGTLVRGSVKDSTNKQYDSRLRTLGKFLSSVRHVDDTEVKSCSKLEYVNFLFNWKEQKMGPANGTAAALLQLHRMEGIPSFLEETDVKKAIKGAGTSCKKSTKGCLTPT